MDQLTTTLVAGMIIGLGATLTFDGWALALKHAFKIPPSNMCLVGRWMLYMREGVFTHVNLAAAKPKGAECAVGWCAHYAIGMTLAGVFLVWAGPQWLRHPTLLPAIVFGVVTVVAPLFVMQPAFGLGFAASKTAHPGRARLRSVMNHLAFGAGLYLFAQLVHRLGLT